MWPEVYLMELKDTKNNNIIWDKLGTQSVFFLGADVNSKSAKKLLK